jgi:hypothetical protein
MIILTNTRIKPLPPVAPRIRGDQPFQPGEVYMIRYMMSPTMVTVVARGDNIVETDLVTVSVGRFDQCVLFRMGRRRRVLGMWLPWFSCKPERVIHLALGDDSVGMDTEFWRNRRCSLVPDAPCPPRPASAA